MAKKIICLENLPYNANIRIGSHHYARIFSESYDVLWISLPWHILQLLKDFKSDRIRNWNFNRPVRITQTLTAITPFICLPYRNNLLLRNDFYIEHYYRFMPFLLHNIRRAGFTNPDIFWFTDPRHISILNYLEAKRIFYRCVDDLENFTDIPRSIVKYEYKLIEKSQAAFFTSLKLMEKFENTNDTRIYLPNGCDFEFFNRKPNARKTDLISHYFDFDKLNVLYIGTIADWFDFQAIEHIANDKGNNIIIVGPVRTSIPEACRNKNNVKFVGPYPYDMMPAFAHLADIGIIPFKVTEMTNAVNPIKLYEYSAAGLPTIAANMKTLQTISGPFYIYDSYSDLPDIIREIASKQKDLTFINKIIGFGRENSWRSRVSDIYKFFED